MTDQNLNENYRSGFVAIVGKPNVGKSTLMNALLKQQVAAVSVRPQTTRKRQLGILTTENAQIIFVDTPGLHKPDFKLSQFINAEALAALHDADLILFLVDGSQPPDAQDQRLADEINSINQTVPVILALNKSELLRPAERVNHLADFHSLVERATTVEISALKGIQINTLLDLVTDNLPLGPQFYPEDQVTDLYERDIAADLIRAACLHYIEDEIPHSMAVRIDEYSERENGDAYIHATLIIEREAHKGIVIGKSGEMLKKIGTMARLQIEAMSERKVYLDLHVRVEKNWRNNPQLLKLFGYSFQGGSK